MISIQQKKNIRKHFSRYANKYDVLEPEINEFKELTGDYIVVKEITGIYTLKNSNVSTKTDREGITKSNKKHLIHTLDIDGINEGMFIGIGNRKYKVIDIEDDNGLSFSYTITLEEC